jgi:signal peptidase II
VSRLRLLHVITTAAACLAADQAAKLMVRAHMAVCDQFPVVSCARVYLGPVPLVRVQNTGTGYVFLRDPTVAVGLGLLGCVLILVYAAWLRRGTWVAVLGVGLQGGGALSNLLDRLLAGHVTDYVNVTPTFTFNLADVFLLVGTVLAIGSIARSLAATEHRPAARLER